MKNYLLLFCVLLLAACSDTSEKATWVAQNIATKQEEPAPMYAAQVDVYSPNVNTIGQVIKQQNRDKWVLVSAQDVAGHPYALVQRERLTLGQVKAIDEVHNIAIIHIRNSYDYDVQAVNSFTTTKNGEQVTASAEQIEQLVQQAEEKPITWQERYQKSQALLEKIEREEIPNYTTYYSKNIFTFNSDALMERATAFIDALNQAITAKNFETVNSWIHSDDVKEAIQNVSKPVKGFDIKEAKKDGVYYFVNGVDENKEEVRLTFMLNAQQYKLIGTNLITAEQAKKTPIVDLTVNKTLEEVPALEMFVKNHVTTIQIETPEQTWQLTKKENYIQVQKDGKNSYSCKDAVIENSHFTLKGCGTQQANVVISTFK